MQLFWGSKQGGDKMLIEGEEVTHLNKSLRKKEGDRIEVIDGSGAIYQCDILQVSRSQAFVQVVEVVQTQKKWLGSIHIGIALTKNIDRIEWFVEKAVEMGVDEISFINCERSVKTNIRMDRINRIVQSSMKQSYNVYNPIVKDNIQLKYLMENSNNYDLMLMPTCEEIPKSALPSILSTGKSTIIIIGPEGDFTPDEIQIGISHGFIPTSMGETRLRTETAGMMAVALFQSAGWGSKIVNQLTN